MSSETFATTGRPAVLHHSSPEDLTYSRVSPSRQNRNVSCCNYPPKKVLPFKRLKIYVFFLIDMILSGLFFRLSHQFRTDPDGKASRGVRFLQDSLVEAVFYFRFFTHETSGKSVFERHDRRRLTYTSWTEVVFFFSSVHARCCFESGLDPPGWTSNAPHALL